MTSIRPDMPKKILIVSAMFPPVASSGIHRVVRLVRYLTELGAEVSVLTIDEKTLPRTFSYDHAVMDKIPDTVKILRVPASQALKRLIELKNGRDNKPQPKSARPVSEPAKSVSGKKRKSMVQSLKDAITLNLHSPDNYAFWIKPAIKAGVDFIRENGIETILSSSPPGSTHVIAHRLKAKTGVKWLADFRDPWSQKRWHNPEMTAFKKRAIRRYEKQTIASADKLIMNTPELLEDFRQRYGEIVKQKGEVITNGFDPADFLDLPGASKPQSQISICHAGTFYRNRSPMSFLNGFARALKTGAISAGRFKIKFIGSVGAFKNEMSAFLDENDLHEAIEVIPPIQHHDCLIEMMKSDVLLIIQPVTTIQIPGKIFEYMATGKPILAISAEGATSNVVINNNLGWWADFDNEQHISEAFEHINKFFNEAGIDGWQVEPAILDKFNGKKLVEKIYELI